MTLEPFRNEKLIFFACPRRNPGLEIVILVVVVVSVVPFIVPNLLMVNPNHRVISKYELGIYHLEYEVVLLHKIRA